MIKLTKIIIFFFISIFFLNSCGFESIYSTKNTNIRFSEIITNDKKTSLDIKKNLSNYYSNDLSKTEYSLVIKLNQNRIIKSKNKKGEALVYSILIDGEILIYKNAELENTLNINEFFDYQNTENKFDLSEYEGNIKNNLISNIANNLIIKIIDLQND